jgi:hypothetical protein
MTAGVGGWKTFLNELTILYGDRITNHTQFTPSQPVAPGIRLSS